MGAIGGIIGASVGILIVAAVSAYQVWTRVLDVEVPLLAPLVGSGIGLLSGTYPALRARQDGPSHHLRLRPSTAGTLPEVTVTNRLYLMALFGN